MYKTAALPHNHGNGHPGSPLSLLQQLSNMFIVNLWPMTDNSHPSKKNLLYVAFLYLGFPAHLVSISVCYLLALSKQWTMEQIADK